MRILWIEDFGKADPETLVGQLFPFTSDRFVEVLGIAIMALRQHDVEGTEAEWEEAYDEIGDAYHEIRPVVHESQFNKILESGRLNEDFDLALIDIDLTEGFFDKSPDGVTLCEEGEWIYRKLHDTKNGLDSEKLAFLTANKDKVPSISERLCRLWHMDNVVAFGKDEPQRLNEWLQKQDEDYGRLRRGILDGKKFASHLVKKTGYKPSFPPVHPFTDEELLGYLIGIRSPSDSKNLRNTLDDIASLWERSTPSMYSSAIQTAMHYTLTNVRNCYAHNRQVTVLPQDVAMLYILNMRAVFDDCSSQLRQYEKVLLKLFRPLANISASQLKDCLTRAYREAWSDYDDKVANEEKHYKKIKTLSWEKESQNGIKSKYRHFNEIANQLVDSEKEGKIARRQLLIQCFWVILGGPPKGNGKSANVALDRPIAEYWCDQLLLATLSHCFPEWDKYEQNWI